MLCLKRAAFLLCLISVAGSARAQSASPAIVTVSFTSAVLQTAEAQRDMAALQGKFAPRQAALQALNDEVTRLRTQLAAASGKPDQPAREQTLVAREKQLDRESEDFKTDSQSESQQAFERIAQKVFTFLQSYSRQHGYTLVIERGSDAAPAVWYAADGLDITQQLTQAYNAQPPAAAGSQHGAGPSQSLPSSPSPH